MSRTVPGTQHLMRSCWVVGQMRNERTHGKMIRVGRLSGWLQGRVVMGGQLAGSLAPGLAETDTVGLLQTPPASPTLPAASSLPPGEVIKLIYYVLKAPWALAGFRSLRISCMTSVNRHNMTR